MVGVSDECVVCRLVAFKTSNVDICMAAYLPKRLINGSTLSYRTYNRLDYRGWEDLINYGGVCYLLGSYPEAFGWAESKSFPHR